MQAAASHDQQSSEAVEPQHIEHELQHIGLRERIGDDCPGTPEGFSGRLAQPDIMCQVCGDGHACYRQKQKHRHIGGDYRRQHGIKIFLQPGIHVDSAFGVRNTSGR